MEIGMLWFDNDQKTDLKSRIGRAVAYYQQKYGQTPNVCFVNPCMLASNGQRREKKQTAPALVANGVEVRESSSLLPNHFWIGVHQPGS